MYSAITRSEWIPLLGKASSYYFEETIGIVTLRLGILTIITVFLAREAWKAWSIMVDVSRREKFDRGQSNPGQSNRGESGGDRFQLWLQFIVITVIPIFIMNVWTIARFLSFEESLKNYGWSYGPSLYGSLAFLLTIVLLIILLVQLNTWRKMTSKSSLEKNANS
jgi:hypothetical protein